MYTPVLFSLGMTPTTNELEEERLTQPCPPRRDADEQTPILSKTLSKVSNPASQCENGKKALIDEQNSKWMLVGIAVSTYMGAFCHGLGKFGSQLMTLF